MEDTPSSEAHMDKCCDICGDVGVIDAIVICTRCKISCEHLYCMRTYRLDYPESWSCEECQQLIKTSSLKKLGELQCDSARPNKLPNDLRRNPMDREKKIQTGKVKPLSAEEVIMLTSGAKISGSPVKASFHPRTILRKRRSILERSPIMTGGIPPKSSSHLVTRDPPLALAKQLRPPIARQQVAQSFGGPRGGVVSSSMKMPIADSRTVSPISGPPKVGKCLYIPASDASWKGSFNVLLNGPKQWEVSGAIQAHPPSRVRKKVYESSMLMPEVLKFEVVQRGSLWTSLFKNYNPDSRDIGIYFFPSASERCEDYMLLLEHIGEQDLLLRSYMDGLELLMFTSKILHTDCQRWNGMYFLWGLFRCIKLTITTIQAEVNQCDDEGDNNKAVDMEIDMMGGQNVGRLDVAVPRIPLQLPLPNHANETLSDIPPGFEKMHRPTCQTSSASAAKSELGACVKVEIPDDRNQRCSSSSIRKDDPIQSSSSPMVPPRLDFQHPLENVKIESP